jgi:hypothetical protein
VVHLSPLLPYVRCPRTVGWINPPFHCHYFSGTHPRDFVIMTILDGLYKLGFCQTLTSALRLLFKHMHHSAVPEPGDEVYPFSLARP